MNVDASDAPSHGGNPAALPEGIDPAGLMDLATGINPWAWPIDAASLSCLKSLPYDSPSLSAAAADYFALKRDDILPTAGSQSAIQMLPTLAPKGRVLMAAPAYEEHAYRWRQAGHSVRYFPHDEPEVVSTILRSQAVEYLVLVSPNNPTGTRYSNAQLLSWRRELPASAMMVVDQAYADAETDASPVAELVEADVVILRSTGKFFGLPGLRLGFVLAGQRILKPLASMQGPWAINSLAQVAGTGMLQDRAWQSAMREKLSRVSKHQSERLALALSGHYQAIYHTPLFNTLKLPLGSALHIQQLAYHAGLSLRVYQWQGIGYLRWGLSADEAGFSAALLSLAERLSVMDSQGRQHAILA